MSRKGDSSQVYSVDSEAVMMMDNSKMTLSGVLWRVKVGCKKEKRTRLLRHLHLHLVCGRLEQLQSTLRRPRRMERARVPAVAALPRARPHEARAAAAAAALGASITTAAAVLVVAAAGRRRRLAAGDG